MNTYQSDKTESKTTDALDNDMYNLKWQLL